MGRVVDLSVAPFFDGDFVGESRICERVVGPLRNGDAETFESGGAAEVVLGGDAGCCSRLGDGRLVVEAVDGGRTGCSAGGAAAVLLLAASDAARGGGGGLILSCTGLPPGIVACFHGSCGVRLTGPSRTSDEAEGVFGSPTASLRKVGDRVDAGSGPG